MVNGFTADTSSATADRLRLWSGYFNVDDSTYRNFFFQQRSTSSAWIQEDDTTQLDQSAQTLLQPVRHSSSSRAQLCRIARKMRRNQGTFTRL